MQYYGFIDCEFTSGYAPRLQSVELINLGCTIRNHAGEELCHYETFVRPTKKSNQKLTRRIRELTKLTQEQIDTAPSFSEFVSEFEAFLQRFEDEYGHQIQWWSWGDFDQIALRQTISVNNYEGRFGHFVEHIQDLQPQVIPQLFLKIGIKKQQLSLVNAKRLFDLGDTIQHQALSDARDLANVFWSFRHQTPNWQLVKSLAPKVASVKPVKAAQNDAVEVWSCEQRLTPESYGVFKQLWQVAPPQFTPTVIWQHRQIQFASQLPIRISHIRAQWVMTRTHLFVTLYHQGQKPPLISHCLPKNKQTKKLFEQLQVALSNGNEVR
ncbi:MAG: exonuclease domain-containing protein [Culicoidibacterales bacterium]